jgi:hypothetical protein
MHFATNAAPTVRNFAQGQRVKIAKKTRVVDKERDQEGAKPGELPPVDVDVTGCEGVIKGSSYQSPKTGKICTPVELPNGAIIAVDENKLENVREEGSSRAFFMGPPSPEGTSYLRELTRLHKENVRLQRRLFKAEQRAKDKEARRGRK